VRRKRKEREEKGGKRGGEGKEERRLDSTCRQNTLFQILNSAEVKWTRPGKRKPIKREKNVHFWLKSDSDTICEHLRPIPSIAPKEFSILLINVFDTCHEKRHVQVCDLGQEE
jgi:hypothetical protein